MEKNREETSALIRHSLLVSLEKAFHGVERMLVTGSVGLTLKIRRSKYSFFPSVMAVKSAVVSISVSLQKESTELYH